MPKRDLFAFCLLFLAAGSSMIVSIGISAKLVSWLDRRGRLDNIRLFGENDLYNRGW